MAIIKIPKVVIFDGFVDEYIECSKQSNIFEESEVFIPIEVTSDCYQALARRVGKAKQEALASGKSRGLGDSLAKLTHATRLDTLALIKERLTGTPCNCHEKTEATGESRQEKLNKLLPYANSTDNKQ